MEIADVFICYSHEDREWKDRVNRFMLAMERAGQFRFRAWDDGRIRPGAKWEEEIDRALAGAKAGVLLISADFLASAFIAEREVPRILKRAREDGLAVFPLLVRPCPWEAFEWLRELQLVNSPEEPLSGCSDHRHEEIITALTWDIGRCVEHARAAAQTVEEAEAVEGAEAGEAEEETVEEAAEREVPAGVSTPGVVVTATEPVRFELPRREGLDREATSWGETFLTNAGVVSLVEGGQSGRDRARVVGLICIFRTKKQRTWFVATETSVVCVLDDAKTAAGHRRVQWTLPLGEATPILVRERPGLAAGLVDVGSRRNWLYTQRLHPDGGKLKASIETMLETARMS